MSFLSSLESPSPSVSHPDKENGTPVLEKNKEIAHTCAALIQSLVEEDVLTPAAVSSASNEQIDQFLRQIAVFSTYDPEADKWGFVESVDVPYLHRKVQQIFGLNPSDPTQEKGPGREVALPGSDSYCGNGVIPMY